VFIFVVAAAVVSLSTQSGKFWIHPRVQDKVGMARVNNNSHHTFKWICAGKKVFEVFMAVNIQVEFL
jgi:hypothetical protein